MIYIDSNIDSDVLLELRHDFNSMYEYVRSFLPDNLKHQTMLVNNTLFILLSGICKRTDVNMDTKKEIQETIFDNIKVVGVLDDKVKLNSVMQSANMNIVNSFVDKEV